MEPVDSVEQNNEQSYLRFATVSYDDPKKKPGHARKPSDHSITF